jgi:outer membrane protein
MPRNALAGSRPCTAFAGALLFGLRALIPLLLTDCAFAQSSFFNPSETAQPGIAERVFDPPTLNANHSESDVPSAQSQARANAPTAPEFGVEMVKFALQEAINYALQNNPRLRSARAAIESSRGQVDVAFAPFLPQVDLIGQYGVVSKTLAPGSPGYAGFILAGDFGTRSYAETEVGLQWTLYDFGRTGGRYGQAIGHERISELQLTRAGQTVEFDVTAAYLDVLLAHASRRVQEDSVRRSQAILDDTTARRTSGVSLKEDVLRAEVQLSESREALILAREAEFNAVARLNNSMGRNAALPLDVVDLDLEPPLPGSLTNLMELAAAQRPEVGVARQAVEVAQRGREVAQGDFLPRIFARASAGHTDGENVINGFQEGAGLHFETPIYAGGQHRGELRSKNAEIEASLADAQVILDAISLQVNIAFRAVEASRERIDLARTAVVQADENLRLLRVRYSNGNATPTDIVDSEAALTRSQQRFFSANYTYLAALARLDYSLGQRQGAFFCKDVDSNSGQHPMSEELPSPQRLPAVP